MNLKAIISALPILRRLWKWMPGPLKIIVLVLAAIVAVKRMFDGDEESGDADPSSSEAEASTSDGGRRSA